MKHLIDYIEEKLIIKNCNNIDEPTEIDDPKKLIGKTIKILSMDDKSAKEYEGKEGKVEMVDSIGQLHGTWGSLAIIPEIDEIMVLDD